MLLVLTSFFLCSGVTAAPRPQSWIPSFDWGYFHNVSGGLVGGLKEYLPDTVVTYLGESAKDGLEVLENLYNDTRQETVDKSSKHIDEVTDILNNFITKIENVYESAKTVAEQDIVLSDAEILDRKEAGDLQGTKEELEQLGDIVKKEREDNENIGGLEGMLQRLITEARGLLSTMNTESDLAWSKVKQLELEFYQVTKLMADTSGNVKESLKQAWSTLNKELEEVSPALSEIFDSVGQESTVKNGTKDVGAATQVKDSVDIGIEVITSTTTTTTTTTTEGSGDFLDDWKNYDDEDDW